MDNLTTFLEFPLDRELYKPRRILHCQKPPLRVLITSAGTKIAQHLMYKICSGEVFGPDQPIILHLVNSKGTVNHRSILLDLEQCGFSNFADSVVSAEYEKSFGNVDVVVLISIFEELYGHNTCNSFLCHLSRTWNVVRNVRLYAKPDVKLIVCSPSTKGVVLSLNCIKKFEPQFISENLTGVVLLDEIISKNLLAANLKTTTDKIKNVTIWGSTAPDIRNATVLMYPPDDKSNLEEVEVPIYEVLRNQRWIYSNLVPNIYNRILMPELVRTGGALASAAARHLKLLFQGSEQQEIVSMAVIIPENEPYGLRKYAGFSLPVATKNGRVRILEDVEYDISTHLMNLRSMYNNEFNSSMHLIEDLINYIKHIEAISKKQFVWNQHTHVGQKCYNASPNLKYIMLPKYEDKTPTEVRDLPSKKSITWEEVLTDAKPPSKKTKSSLRFDLQKNSSNYI